MKNNELFLEIKNKIITKNVKNPGLNDTKLAIYNYNTYKEILSKKIEDIEIEEINDNDISNLNDKLEYFFKEYPTYDDEFDEFIKYICLYLHFIAKKPFHPAEVKNNSYCCNLKEKYKNDKNSLCVDCIATSGYVTDFYNYFIEKPKI